MAMQPATKALIINSVVVFAMVVAGNLASGWISNTIASRKASTTTPPAKA